MKRALLVCLAACGDNVMTSPDAPATPDAPLVPTANLAREIISTGLAVDVATRMSTATIEFGPSDTAGATLEVGDLVIMSTGDVANERDGKLLHLALAPSTTPTTVTITYTYAFHERFDGVSMNDYTVVWPYHCGNMFPCHSDPADGTTFTLDVTGVADGEIAIYPPTISEQAPSYQIAWAIDAYQELAVGTTAAGTQISMWHRESELDRARIGSADLVAAVNFFESTLGPYRFGPKMGGVSVAWGPGGLGGMEHHPFWHTASRALQNTVTNVHEAAHGWYGDGVRIACWEDFALSEGTVTYLTGRALDVTNPTLGQIVWDSYTVEYNGTQGAAPVWPEGCGEIDVIEDRLLARPPYIRGAMFYRAVALKVGATMLDAALGKFYMDYQTKAARMTDMLATIKDVTGFDPTACAQSYLRATTKPPAQTACP